MSSVVPRTPLTPAPVTPGWRAVAGNSLWLLLEKGARGVLGVTVGLWMARHLGPSEFGTLTATLAWVALFGAAAGLGIEPIVVRELVRRPAERSVIMATALGLRLAGGASMALLAIALGGLWPSSGLQPGLVAIASLGTLFGISETYDLWFQATLKAREAAIGRTAVYLAACGARVVLIVNGAEVTAFLWLAAAEAGLTAGALTWLFTRQRRSAGAAFSASQARALLRESWPNIISNLAAMAYLRADRVMLAALQGEATAGIFSAAVSLVEIWTVIPLALANSIVPMLTPLQAADPKRYLLELGRLARLHALMAWGLTLLLVASAATIVPLLLGPAYGASASVLMVLSASLPFSFLGLAAVPWYTNAGLTHLSMGRHLIGGTLNLGLNLFLIPRYGPTGAALATTLAFAVAHVLANAIDTRTRPIFRLQLRALCLLPPIPPP